MTDYLSIAAWLRHRIETGELPPGDRVPGSAELMRLFDVGEHTARRALTELKQATSGFDTGGMTSDDSVTDATHPAEPDRIRRSEGADTVSGAFMIITNPVLSRAWANLTPTQADGVACVACGCEYLTSRVPHRPLGRSHTGSQVFACVDPCAITLAGGVQ